MSNIACISNMFSDVIDYILQHNIMACNRLQHFFHIFQNFFKECSAPDILSQI